GSMGRVGACGDNAAMESFFALVQKNVLDRGFWNRRRELSAAIEGVRCFVCEALIQKEFH
ncbi:hypothetical protein I4J40_14425, partial [Corynebacterium belfantii]|nr:hypothetical protein [Corynebacterium belfantii]